MLPHETYLKPWIFQKTSYSGILRYIQAYLSIALIHLGMFVTVCNLGILRTLVFSEPCQTSTMQCFAKMFKCIRIYQLHFINVSATRYQLYLNLATFCITLLLLILYLPLDISATPCQCINYSLLLEEAVVRSSPVNNMFLNILQNSQENTYVTTPFIIKLQVQALPLVTLLTYT